MFDPGLVFHVAANQPIRIRLLHGEPLFQTTTHVYKVGEREVERYFWRMVVRGRESEGVKILSVTKTVHKAIVEGILENPIHPVLNWRQKLILWISRRGLFGWRPLRSLAKYLPKPKDCLDEEVGYDFKLEKTVRHLGEENGYPVFSVMEFVPVSRPAGTSEEMAAWKKGGDVLHQLFLKGVSDGNQTVQTSSS